MPCSRSVVLTPSKDRLFASFDYFKVKLPFFSYVCPTYCICFVTHFTSRVCVCIHVYMYVEAGH